MDNDFFLPEKDSQLVRELEQLLNFGYKQGNKILIPDAGKDIRLATLFQMVGVVHHLTRGGLLRFHREGGLIGI